MKKIINAAIAYDFDGTLTSGYMQDHSFFPALDIKEPFKDFWPKVKDLAQQNDMDEILAYMFLMLREANYKGLSLRKDGFIKHGKGMKFFLGVESWFERINKYGFEKGVNIKHYIISSGLREMIEGTSIAKNFSSIFASGFMYNQDDVAVWPAVAVNYTNKTQYVFRINKGIENSWDNKSLNNYWGEAERPTPQENIIYLGDGDTDVPAMKMVKHLGGHAVAVYDPSKTEAKSACEHLLSQDRADFASQADYSENAELELIIKGIIDKISNKNGGQNE